MVPAPLILESTLTLLVSLGISIKMFFRYGDERLYPQMALALMFFFFSLSYITEFILRHILRNGRRRALRRSR